MSVDCFEIVPGEVVAGTPVDDVGNGGGLEAPVVGIGNGGGIGIFDVPPTPGSGGGKGIPDDFEAAPPGNGGTIALSDSMLPANTIKNIKLTDIRFINSSFYKKQ